MIEIQGLTFNYETQVSIQFPDFKVKNKDHLLISGPSGSGKTTLLHLLCGLLKPSHGKIVLNDKEIVKFSAKTMDKFRGNNIGIVFQKPYFINSLTVLENIELMAWLAKGNKQTDLAIKLLERLDLAHHIRKKCYELSTGQQQRLSIIRAIVNKPSLLFADEPTSSLDDLNCENVIELLFEVAETYEASLLVVSHDQRLKQYFTKQYDLH